MAEKTYVIGVGMTKFEKPGSKDWDYPDMGREAGQKALADAGIAYVEVESAFLAYCYGDSTSGQRALYELGLTGIPAINVNNNCSTGSSALYLARKFIQGGLADCVLALGFEKMQKGSLKGNFDDRTNPMDKHVMDMIERRGFEPAPPAAQVFGNAGREYMERYGVTAEHFAKIGEKNHRHSVNNPYSQFRDEYSLEDILAAPMVYDPLTKLQCCPTSDGGAAAVIASERFVREHGLEARAVEIAGQSMTTDFQNTFSGSDMAIAGYHMTEAAAREAYEESGLGPEDAEVVELHDCFSANELITYQGLGLCEEGKAGQLIDEGAVTYGGRWVVNPSGGLISKGHPLGATGLAQCSEITWQLRGEAEARQVDGARVGIQHNLGLGGAAVVTVYRKDAGRVTAGLENRVAIITGGANGIGRQHALLFASLGAKVVVNDLGGGTDGSGADTSAAQLVVDEIVAAGGEAVASTDSVSSFDGAKAIVDTAVEAFGDLHVVVNNAGILRDRMLVSMSEQEFDDVVAVHLKGTFNVTRHAADLWRERHKAGDAAPRNIVNTSSGAGLHGNAGQTNYAAAKAGIAAMTIVNALELERYNVRANCIAPVARTRLTLQTPGMGDAMGASIFDPEKISPLVAVLAGAECPFNGQVFSVYGGAVGIYAGWSIAEEVVAPGGAANGTWTVDELTAAMDELPTKVEVNHQMAALMKSSSGGSSREG